MKRSRKPREYLQTKSKKQVVDYFPRGGAGGKEDFTYNTAMIKTDPNKIGGMLKKKTVRKEKTMPEEDIDVDVVMENTVGKEGSRALLPKFKIGDLVLLCISEIRKDYMIANYTRNKKAMIHSSYSGMDEANEDGFSFEKFFKLGQFISGAVVSPGNDIQLPGGKINKKILVSIDPKIINTGLNVGSLKVGMDLYGKLIRAKDGVYHADFKFVNTPLAGQLNMDDDESEESNEEEEINFDQEEQEDIELEDDDIMDDNDDNEDYGVEDKMKRAKKYPNSNFNFTLVDNEESQEILQDKIPGSYYYFKVISINKESDHIQINISMNHSKYKFPIKEIDYKYLRPGFLFKSNSTRELVNGCEIAFGGNIGTIFSDHIKNKKKSKGVLSRVIHLSLDKKATSLSTLSHIVSLHVEDVEIKKRCIGRIYKGIVAESLFGNSYNVTLEQKENDNSSDYLVNKIAFIHNSQLDNREDKFDVANVIEHVLVKEYNYFDDRPLLTSKKEAIESGLTGWDNLTVGKIVTGKIKEISSDYMLVSINHYMEGKIPKEHITDFPLNKIPKKFTIGKEVEARIYASDYSKKNLVLTMKESLMDPDVKLVGDLSLLNEGEEIYVTYVGNGLFQHSGCVLAKLMNFQKEKEKFTVGKLYNYKIYKLNHQTKKIFLTDQIEVWQPGVGDYDSHIKRNTILSSISLLLNKNESTLSEGMIAKFEIIPIKKLIKFLLKKGLDQNLISDNSEALKEKFLIARTFDEANQKHSYAFIPKELVSDFHKEKMFKLYSSETTESLIEMLVLYSNNGVTFVTPKRSLVDHREKIANGDDTLIEGHVYYGYVNKKNSKGVVVQFLGRKKIQIRIKEEEMNHSFDQGSTVLVKFSSKRFVLDIEPKTAEEESLQYFRNFIHDMRILTKYDRNVKTNQDEVKVNSILEGSVGLIKEYGVLVHIHPKVTGFLRNEHIKTEDKLTVGDKRRFRVIDVDPIDSIAYLTDDINITTSNQIDFTTEQRMILEIFHETHISACLEDNQGMKIYVPCNLYNFNYESSQFSDLFKIGDVISSKIAYSTEDGIKVASFPSKLLKKVSGSDRKRKNGNVISIGSTVSGVINGVKGNYVYVYIDKMTLGKLHINHFKGDLDQTKSILKSTKALNNSESLNSKIHDELKIKCKIISIQMKDDVKICELTGADELPDVNLSKEIDLSGNKANIGLISQVNKDNKFPVKIETLGQKHQIHYSLLPTDKISTEGINYKVGDKVEFYSFKTKPNENEEEVILDSLVPLNSIQTSIAVGSTVPVRVLKSISGRGLVVDITVLPYKHIEAFVDICEITDFLHPNPLRLFPKGQIMNGRVLSMDSKSNKYMVSLRNSITNSELYDVITNGSTLKFSQTFEEFERIRDMRNKIHKFGGDTVIEPNLVAIGYITSSSEKGVFIKLAENVIVRASMRELTDEKTSKPFLLFKPNTLVICRVTSVYKKDADTPAKINVSLRESVVKFNMTLKMKDLIQNNFYECIIMNEADGKYEVTVVGSTFTGLLKRKNMKKDTKLQPKQQVILHLVKLDKNCHPPKMRFSNLLVDNIDKSLVINSLSDKEMELSKTYVELYNNIKAINENMQEKEAESQMKEINEADIDFEALLDKKEHGDYEDDQDEEEEEEMVNLEEEVEEDLIMPETNNILYDYKSKAKLFNNQMEVDDEQEDLQDTDEINQGELPQSSLAHSSRQREKEHLREEIQIREIEAKGQEEKNAEYYEKLILADPDKSLYWIQYASYILEKLNLQSARKIFERAITSIDIAKTKEKLNVWIAYMNLENCYGTLETFKSLVERALEVNDKKVIYKHLINIYKMSNKFDLAHEVFKIALKSFFSDFDLWKSYLEFLFQMQRFDQKSKLKDILQPKEGLNKAFQVLPKKRHVDLLVIYGQLQYTNEMNEEARNTFESILKNMPKRSDIWLVYIDKEIKHSKNLHKIRHIFEKMFQIDFKLKTLKTIIKKYLEFEKEHGDVMSLEAAKALTQKIIAERLNALKTDVVEEEEDVEEVE